jgi:hypothetical protein
MLSRIGSCGSARGQTQFGENIGHVAMDRMLAQDQVISNFLITQALSGEAKHLKLSRRKPLGRKRSNKRRMERRSAGCLKIKATGFIRLGTESIPQCSKQGSCPGRCSLCSK